MASLLLPLLNMHQRHAGLTVAIASCYLEAARVCLDRHHSSPQQFTIADDGVRCAATVDWEQTDVHTRAAWANADDATRDGAYGCALAATEITRGYVAVRRAETRTGADYYVAPIGQLADDLEKCLRLEVSGTDLGDSEVKTRLGIKVRQAAAGNSSLPALAAVVGFRSRLILIQTVEEPK